MGGSGALADPVVGVCVCGVSGIGSISLELIGSLLYFVAHACNGLFHFYNNFLKVVNLLVVFLGMHVGMHGVGDSGTGLLGTGKF